MTDTDYVSVILKQIEIYNSEIRQMQKGIFQALFGFITIMGISASVLFGQENLINSSEKAKFILLGLSQIEYFIVLFIILLAIHEKVLSAYIASLESKLDKNNEISFYHSTLSPSITEKFTSPDSILGIVTIIGGLFIYGLCFYTIQKQENYWLFYLILVLEILLLFYFAYNFFSVYNDVLKRCENIQESPAKTTDMSNKE